MSRAAPRGPETACATLVARLGPCFSPLRPVAHRRGVLYLGPCWPWPPSLGPRAAEGDPGHPQVPRDCAPRRRHGCVRRRATGEGAARRLIVVLVLVVLVHPARSPSSVLPARPGAAVKIKKSKNGSTKFKIRCARYLYTLRVADSHKANRLKDSLPPGIKKVEL